MQLQKASRKKSSIKMPFYGSNGFEFFPEEGSHLLTMAQCYPRLARFG